MSECGSLVSEISAFPEELCMSLPVCLLSAMCAHGGMTICTRRVSSSAFRCSGVLGLDLSFKNDKKYISAVSATPCVTFGHSSPNDTFYLESPNHPRLHSLEVTLVPVLSCRGRRECLSSARQDIALPPGLSRVLI